VPVCDNIAFHKDLAAVLAKHTKHLRLVDILAEKRRAGRKTVIA
jgi:hypothetical protein